MAYIYKIDNLITGKAYIGQTIKKPEIRFKEHIKEAKEALDGKRQSFPLFHRMIIKYGENNFIMTILEECDKAELDEREKYWIYFYDTFNNGYNATIGGQNINPMTNKIIGQKVSQYDKDGTYIATFESAQEAANAVKVHASNIRKNCNLQSSYCANYIWRWGDSTESLQDVINKKGRTQSVIQLDLNDNIIARFPSIKEASKQTATNYQSIWNVCHEKQKTAGGYKWRII